MINETKGDSDQVGIKDRKDGGEQRRKTSVMGKESSSLHRTVSSGVQLSSLLFTIKSKNERTMVLQEDNLEKKMVQGEIRQVVVPRSSFIEESSSRKRKKYNPIQNHDVDLIESHWNGSRRTFGHPIVTDGGGGTFQFKRHI